MENKYDFSVGKDVVDSLKLEVSSLGPIKEKQVKDFAKTIFSEISSTYKEFIPENTLEKNKNISDKIIVVDRKTLRNLLLEWTQDGIYRFLDPGKIAGSYFIQGKFIACDNPNNHWEILKKSNQKRFMEKFGNEENAKKIVTKSLFTEALVHEIIHSFKRGRLPADFEECAVRYYEQKIAKKVDPNHVVLFEKDEKITKAYQELIEEFGENNIHNLFFNGKIKYFTRKNIFKKFNQQKADLGFTDEFV